MLRSLAIKVTFTPSGLWERSWYIRKTPSQKGKEKMWCKACPALSVYELTKGRLAGRWTITLQNIGELSEMGMWQPQQWQSTCLLLHTSGLVKGNSDRYSPSCLEPMPSRVLPHPKWTGPSQQGKGNSMPPCWTAGHRSCTSILLFCCTLHFSMYKMYGCMLPCILLFIYNLFNIFPSFYTSLYVSHYLSPPVCTCI